MAELSTIARPYAKAAFEHALATASLGEWSVMLAVAATVAQQEGVKKFLDSPAMNTAQQAQMFIDVCDGTFNADGKNFIKILAENKRLELLSTISKLFEAQKSIQEHTVDVELTTAFALDSGSEKRLVEVLAKKLAREVKVNITIDPLLLGGVIVKAGDLVIDGSVRGRLAKLAEALNS